MGVSRPHDAASLLIQESLAHASGFLWLSTLLAWSMGVKREKRDSKTNGSSEQSHTRSSEVISPGSSQMLRQR